MKLEFITEEMEYLRPVLRETRSAEETAEAIIPDACPDVSEILHTGGFVCLRGLEISEGGAAVSAGAAVAVGAAVSAGAAVAAGAASPPQAVSIAQAKSPMIAVLFMVS